MSTVHSEEADLGLVTVDVGDPKARREIEKALALNPNLADAYAQLGWIKNIYEWDWTGADEAYKKGLELEPENANLINGASYLAATLGRFNESIKLAHRAIEIDPVNFLGYYNLGLYTWYTGLFDESIDAFKYVLNLIRNVRLHICKSVLIILRKANLILH